MAKVLVTCVGSGVGQSVIDSLSFTGRNYIIGCDANRNVYAFNKCNEFQIVPSIYSDEYVDFLLNICIEKGVEVLIPGHDHELSLLSKNIDKFESKNIEVIVSPPDIIEISRDKFEWHRIFSSRGISIVPTFKVSDFKKKPDHSIFPAIIKPAGGSASQGITILKDISEFQKMNDENIIQPYLFPAKDDVNYEMIKKFVDNGKFVQMSEISIQLIFTKKSEFVSIFISKNVLKNGVPVFVDPIQKEEFEYLNDILKFVPILKEFRVKGPVNIQGRITDNGLFFFEMNLRFTGITGNRAQLGFNEVEFLVNNFLGKKGFLNGYSKNKLGARQVACTTIPRLPELKCKKNITILGIETEIAKKFVAYISKKNIYSKIYAICSSKHCESLRQEFDSDIFHTLNNDNDELQSIYCQTDTLINFTSCVEVNYESDAILFIQEQLKFIIQANIPLIINAYNTDKELFLNKVISKSFLNIHILTSAIKYLEIDIAQGFEKISENIVNDKFKAN